MLDMPAIHRKSRRIILFDLDETLVKSKQPTREPLYRVLFDSIHEVEPDVHTDYAAFKELTHQLNIRHNGNAAGWQELLRLPKEWTHGVYEKAAIPMAMAVCRECGPDRNVIGWLEYNRSRGIEQFLFTQSTQTYCNVVLPHLGLDHIFAPDHILHVGWSGYQLKTEKGIYDKIAEIPAIHAADIRDMVDDSPFNLKAGHTHGGFRTWLNGGDLNEDMRPYVFQHHPHIHQTLTALAA